LYSRFQLAKKYLIYYLTAANGRGHGIHSPFVFDFVTKVLNNRDDYAVYHEIEKLRAQLLKNKTRIVFQDFGAGGSSGKTDTRRISDITRHAAKNKKMGQLLFRIVHYYQPKTMVELGTSVGLTTAYLALAFPSARLLTLEGAETVATVAKKNLDSLGLHHVDLLEGNFDDQLPVAERLLAEIDFAFIDGNHRKKATLHYFKRLEERVSLNSMIIVDDIHWSLEMEEAWKEIKEDPRVMMTIDLFFMGLVFFRNSFKVKQNFTIRF
jgi:predicted O-methyltransferase YrrM